MAMVVFPLFGPFGLFCFPSYIIAVQFLSRVRLFETPWIAACQASLSFTVTQSLLQGMSIELVVTSNHPIPLPPASPFALNFSQH